ncbi:HAMP domain-containing sensor histidine kinase [Ruminococcus flavefaciens]|uniref:HAMP domain-containing sensor histidine kinase n=1 Tax=Ruminococcus flavefaciens TaxID=1265 RepID=UPI000A6F423F|nr:HAMP domain-containing sensor histidine kinase [Ruminococcus flavefaciens]
MPQYTTEINRLIIDTGEKWDEISSLDNAFVESGEAFDYAVIDNEGRLLCYTKEGMSTTVSSATGHYDIIRDIGVNGETAGKLIVHNPYAEQKHSSDVRNAIMIGSMAALMIMISVVYFIILRKRVVDPFRKLKNFAVRVAGGDLETPLEMDRGNIFGAFTESFDIMREELKASRKREEAAVKSRKELIAELSHDIKTPVSSIKAMVDYLELVTQDEETKETLKSINSKADRIDKLVLNMFHATLEELEQLEVNPQEMSSRDIENIIKECDALKRVTEADIKDCMVYADKLRLEQVFGNIFSNSYKYADTEIRVTSFFDDGFFVIEVSDKGGGVPDEELDIIMEKFCRGTNAAGKEGSGIGLYISHYLIGQMGGELTCRNNGEGFTVSLSFRLI